MTPELAAEVRRLRAEGLTQAQIAKALGTSQAGVSRELAPRKPLVTYPHTYQGPIPAMPPAALPRPAPPPSAEPVGLVEDLERRIADLDRTGSRAFDAGSYTPSVAAQTAAARLRRELEDVRRAEEAARLAAPPRPQDPDDALVDQLVRAIELLPESVLEAVEDAVARRRTPRQESA